MFVSNTIENIYDYTLSINVDTDSSYGKYIEAKNNITQNREYKNVL